MRADPRAGTAICFVGFGDLACSWAEALQTRDDALVSAYVRYGSASRRSPDWDARIKRTGVSPADDIVVVSCADVLVAAVPARAAREVADATLPHLRPETLYVDPSSGAPDRKLQIASTAARHGIRYVDVALLGTVAISGLAVPQLAAGPGAAEYRAVGRRLGMAIPAL